MRIVAGNSRRKSLSGSVLFLLIALVVLVVMLIAFDAPEPESGQVVTETITCDAEIVENEMFVTNGRTFYGGQYQSRDRAFSGTYSCKLGQDRTFGIRYDIVDAEPGTRYKASVWASRTSGNRPNLVVSDLGSFYVAESIPVIRRADGWELIEVFFSVPEQVDEFIKVYVYANEGSGAIYYDDLKIERLGTGSVQVEGPPFVDLTMEQSAYQKLNKKKWDAVANGILIADDTDWVNATLQTRGQEAVPVEVRLKGDWLDHLREDKWSMRIKVKSPATWNRLVTFSVHSPETRFYLREWLYHKVLEKADVLTPRYDFIQLALNNRTLGLYAYEEHFEKQLVEYKQRREGPILKMAEEGFWLNYKRQEDIYGAGTIPERMTDAFWQSEIQPFKENKLFQNPQLMEAFERARDLLYGFKYDLLEAKDVFDLELLGRYYAVTDIQQAYHGITWHNQRFYYNPITGKLEPIGFDGFGDLTAPTLGSGPFLGYYAHVNSTEDLFGKLFGDPEFVRVYHRALMEVSNPEWYEPAYLELEPLIKEREELLSLEFVDADLDLDNLRERARMIRYHLFPLDDVSLIARSTRSASATQQVTVTNHFQLPLDVVGYAGTDQSKLRLLDTAVFIPSGRRFKVPPSRELSIPAYAKYVAFQLAGVDSIKFSSIARWSSPELQAGSILLPDTDLGLFDFIQIAGREAVIRSGTHTVATDLIFPKGISLVIEPGTTLDLVAGACVVVQGPVRAIGLEESPILIQSSDRSASGFTVLNANTSSTLQNVRFDGLNTYSRPGHTLTGAVTFFQSDVLIRNCAFVNNQCEDALNTFRCKITFDGIHIANTLFDGFDSDFCEGTIRRATFANVENDALDFSGSAVVIEDCNIQRAGDKGISVGEESRIKVVRAHIEDCNIGVASKDLSILEVIDISMKKCKQGFTAYQKKPEFGPAQLMVSKYNLDRVRQTYLIERGSRLILGGKEITGE